MELLGTNCLVSKPKQRSFYATDEEYEAFGRVLTQQGLTYSEGLTRVMRTVGELPEEMWPVVFKQAPGNAAFAIAQSIKGLRLATDPDAFDQLKGAAARSDAAQAAVDRKKKGKGK